MNNPAIKSQVSQLWDKFWSGGIANPLMAMEQISYLLFVRRLDALDEDKRQKAEFSGEKYKSMFAGKFTNDSKNTIAKKELRWAHLGNLPAKEALDTFRDFVFPFMKSLGKDEDPFARHMKDAVFMIPKASLMIEAMGIIDSIYEEMAKEQAETGQTFHDLQGDLYEYLLDQISSAGRNGQFRTPRHIIQMICSLVNPQLGNLICDPACGTGGFLLGAYQHILTSKTSAKKRTKNEHGLELGLAGDKMEKRGWKILHESLHGYDFDTTMVRIALMNLMLHGVERPAIDYMDTLSKRYEDKDKYDVILANPPFKGNLDKGDINEEITIPSTKTELLFVDRILNLLRVGGKAGVIVPAGVLFGSSKAHVALRKRVIEEGELQGVISMPSGIFKPYAGVSTAVLVFVKGGKTENVWFYDMQADGLSLDDKRQKVDADDIPDIVARWAKRDAKKDKDRTAKAFMVPLKEIVENKYDLSVNRYKELKVEEVHYDPPKVIIKRLKKLEHEILKDLEVLEGMVKWVVCR